MASTESVPLSAPRAAARQPPSFFNTVPGADFAVHPVCDRLSLY
jgi:hypothetical protein